MHIILYALKISHVCVCVIIYTPGDLLPLRLDHHWQLLYHYLNHLLKHQRNHEQSTVIPWSMGYSGYLQLKKLTFTLSLMRYLAEKIHLRLKIWTQLSTVPDISTWGAKPKASKFISSAF